MKYFSTTIACLLAITVHVPVDAVDDAWGPTSRVSIVRTGAHVIARDLSFPLNRYDEYVRQGATLSQEELDAFFPDRNIDPLGTIREQIYLLQAVRSNRLDPYFAFRLGALGTVVADVTAPMKTASGRYRDAYFRDAEAYIGQAQIQTLRRDIVDATYFPDRMRDAAEQDATIQADYQSGLGFEGLAVQTLAEDASRSVDAVADVYYTIFVSDVSRLNVSLSDMRGYALDALAFYLKNRKTGEAEAAYENVISQGVMTPELERAIGDVYFDAGYFDRAMVHYESVLQRDVTQSEIALRVAKHYEGIGDTALAAGNLPGALAAYERAVAVDPLLEEPHRKMFDTRRAIGSREARLEAARTALELAAQYVGESQAQVQRRDYLSAMSSLREAQAHYRSITDEFQDEFREASRGMRSLEVLLDEVRQQLGRDVQRFSGSGYAYEIRKLAESLPGVEQEAFQMLSEVEVNSEMQALSDAVADELSP